MRDYHDHKEQKERISKVASKDPEIKIAWDPKDLNQKLRNLQSGAGFDQFDPFNPARHRGRKKKGKQERTMSGDEYLEYIHDDMKPWKRMPLYFPRIEGGEKWHSFHIYQSTNPV